MSNRASNRTRGAKATRKRTAHAIRSETNVVAFARTEDAHTLTENKNNGKRHAARMLPAAENSGARTKNDPRIDLRTGHRIQGGVDIHIVTTKNLPTDATR